MIAPLTKTVPLAVFAKTPGLSPIKTRLAARIGSPKAEEFYRLSLGAVQAVVDQAVIGAKEQGIEIQPYWALAEAPGSDFGFWDALASKNWGRLHQLAPAQAEASLGERLFTIYNDCLRLHGSALLMGADSPLIEPAWIVNAAREVARAKNWVLGRALDGGFYLMGGSRPLSREFWLGIPYSSPETAKRLAENLRTFPPHLPICELPTCGDVDTFEDLLALGRTHVASTLSEAPLLAEQSRLVDWAQLACRDADG